MNTRSLLHVLSVAILAAFSSQSLAQSAVSYGVTSSFSAVPTVSAETEVNATEVMTRENVATPTAQPNTSVNTPATAGLSFSIPQQTGALTSTARATSTVSTNSLPKIAVILPPVNSPFDEINNAIIKGIDAANSRAGTPVEVLPLHRKAGQNAMSQLQDAALMGAVVAIGPMTRDEVAEVSRLSFLPLPVVALNRSEQAELSPKLMINFSLSAEEEAKQIAQLAIAALPATNSKGEKPKVIIFEVSTPLEQRIANVYAQELQVAQIPFERVQLTQELMNQPRFYESLQSEIEKPKLEALPDRKEDPYNYNRVKARNDRLMSEYRAQLAFAEPPYFAALLAMDSRTAALVTPRLPRLTRAWGTSLVNPGDTSQGYIASLTYDLRNVGLVDAPFVLNQTATNSDNPSSDIPKDVLQRRLFAFGSDAFRLASQWMHWQKQIEFSGDTGKLYLNVEASAEVIRHAQPAIIEPNKIRAISAQKLIEPVNR